MDNKITLRKKAKDIRKNLDIDKISAKIVDNIRQTLLYKNSKNIMIFYPLENEINLLSLLEDDKNFYLPKINGEELQVCPFDKNSNLELSRFKTKEPCVNPVDISSLDLVVTPSLMCDKTGYRLGYGGGFYDRFFKRIKNVKKIAVVTKNLMVEKLPIGVYDVKMDLIITD